MGILEVLLTGVGLSMDAAAVGMTNGLNEPKMRLTKILLIALFFGVFQGVMPLIGYFAGTLFAEAVASIAPYVALVLLGFIGGKMIYEALKKIPASNPQQLADTLLQQAVTLYGGTAKDDMTVLAVRLFKSLETV